MLGYGKDSHTYKVFNTYHKKVIETVDVRFDETNGSQREHLPSVLDEPSPEEVIKLKATDDVVPTKESALLEEIVPIIEETHDAPTDENDSEENAQPTSSHPPAHPRVANEV